MANFNSTTISSTVTEGDSGKAKVIVETASNIRAVSPENLAECFYIYYKSKK